MPTINYRVIDYMNTTQREIWAIGRGTVVARESLRRRTTTLIN